MTLRRIAIASILATGALALAGCGMMGSDKGMGGAMDLVVREARALAHAGDVVLLAPAAASMDMFTDYGARGDAFVGAVDRLAAGE